LSKLNVLFHGRMPSSGILRHVPLVRTEVSEERSASIIKVTKIGEIGTKIAVSSNRRTLRRVFLRSFRRLLVTGNVPNSLILVTFMM
jgi:hypothetical protein